MFMENHLNAQFNCVSISSQDFREAYEYMEAWDSQYPAPVRRSLLTAAIVAYSRPFLDSKGQSQATSKVRLSDPSLTDPQKEMHKQIVALRKEAVGHSDFNRKPTKRMSSQSTGHSRVFSIRSRPFDVLDESISIEHFLQLCSVRLLQSQNKMFELNCKLENNKSL